MPVKISGSLIPGAVNTPLDARARAATLADLEAMQNPYVGEIVWCAATAKHYVITSLKSRVIGARTVANAAVDTYAELAPGGGSGASLTTLQLVKPEAGLHLIVKLAGQDGTLANASTLIDTANVSADRVKVRAFLASGQDGAFSDCPAAGFGSPYDGAAVTVDLSGLTALPVTLFYAWSGESGVLSDWRALRFPCAGGGGGEPGERGPAGPAGGSFVIEVADELPAAPDAFTLYLIPDDEEV